MFRTYSRSLWHIASGASPRTAKLVTQTSPRFTIAPLLRQPPRTAFSSKSDKENKDPPPPYLTIDREAERKRGQELLESDPSKVSSQSSVRHVIEEPQAPPTGEHDMAGELKHDIDIVKDTFRFKSVPRESHILGLAGTLPYMGTSLSTVFLAWDLNKQWPTGNAFYDTIFVDHETAKYLLSVIEPLQLGYGAVIISFLGAIHWGLEYAEKEPLRERTRFRYGMGLAASIIAWPTLFLPVEYALTTQFMAFVALYFADSRAATRGWAPQWYGTYRFLLTAMVGLAIFISLVGRAKISQGDSLSGHGLSDNFSRSGIADTKTNWTKLEEEEKERVKREKKKKAKEEEKKKQEEMQEKMKSEKGHDQAKTETEDSDKSEEQGKNDEKDDDQGSEESKDQEKYSDKESDDDKGKDKEDNKNKGNDESKDEGKDEKSEKNEESEEKESKDKDKDEGSKDKDGNDKPKDTKSKGGKKE